MGCKGVVTPLPANGSVVGMGSALSKSEEIELACCEETIAKALRGFLDIGAALGRIQTNRLYRWHFTSFEDYCQRQWGMSRVHAYRLISAAALVTRLQPIGYTPLPAHEAQVRPLTRLEPDVAIKCWRIACENAHGETVTTRMVTEAVRKVLPQHQSAIPSLTRPVMSAPDLGIYEAQAVRAARALIESVESHDPLGALTHFRSLQLIIERMTSGEDSVSAGGMFNVTSSSANR